MTTLGEALVQGLRLRGVDLVFGIPGVHTVELYRGLAGSGIRHVTPRHEQGAGFMADGYARVSGRPGIAFVITGPGLTNTLTPMAQARADSVPMLVISGVNLRDTLGRGLGHLHELPDQNAMTALVALSSERIESADALDPALNRAFAGFAAGRPGPRHIEVPTDVMTLAALPVLRPEDAASATLPMDALRTAAAVLAQAERPVILAGGGARRAGDAVRAIAEHLGAPVVQTVNARGLMHGHPLTVAASPSLEPVRALIREADVALAIGTEFGPTDYDMYAAGDLTLPRRLIRIEIDADQMARHPVEVALPGNVDVLLPALLAALPGRIPADGPLRAARTRDAAFAALDRATQAQIAILEALRDTLPGTIIVGDSTQPVYAGNLYFDHDRPGGWFNAATGYGALGYGLPAAIGAALAAPGEPVICIAGDGGVQFTLPELMTAVQERLPVVLVIWNNRAYREIAEAMLAAGVTPVGCDPLPPDFAHAARSFGVRHVRVAAEPRAVAAALGDCSPVTGPVMIEIMVEA